MCVLSEEYLLAALENNFLLGWKLPAATDQGYKMCIKTSIFKPSKVSRINDLKELTQAPRPQGCLLFLIAFNVGHTPLIQSFNTTKQHISTILKINIEHENEIFTCLETYCGDIIFGHDEGLLTVW